VLRLLVVEDGGGVLHDRAVEVLRAALGRAEPPEDEPLLPVPAPLERVAGQPEERLGLFEQVERLVIFVLADVDEGAPDEDFRLQLDILIHQRLHRLGQHQARLVERAQTPVADAQLVLRLRSLRRHPLRAERRERLEKQVFGLLLSAGDVPGAAEPAGQGAALEQDFGLGRGLHPPGLRPLPDATPQVAERLRGGLELTLEDKVRGQAATRERPPFRS
jgi:hypothetical protein